MAMTREQLTERAVGAAKVWTNKDLDGVMSRYSDDIKYWDLGLKVYGIDKAELRALLKSLFDSVSDFKMEAISLNFSQVGTTTYVFTEYKMTGKYDTTIPHLGVEAKGQRITSIGGSFNKLKEGTEQVDAIRHYSRYFYGDDVVPDFPVLG